MKTKIIELYEYSELSAEAKKKALDWFIQNNEHTSLEEDMTERAKELLKENGIEIKNNFKVMFSLSYCQGDGVMFAGNFKWKEYTVTINHSGRYYHSNSKETLVTVETDEEENYAGGKAEQEFETIYQKICKDLEKEGYSTIEGDNSEESFELACEVNEWTFKIDGTFEQA